MAEHGLVIQALNYGIDQRMRDQVRDRVLSDAIQAWRSRIRVMAKALGCTTVQVLGLRGGPGNPGPRPVVMSARSPGHAPPARVRIQVQVSGRARARGCQ